METTVSKISCQYLRGSSAEKSPSPTGNDVGLLTPRYENLISDVLVPRTKAEKPADPAGDYSAICVRFLCTGRQPATI